MKRTIYILLVLAFIACGSVIFHMWMFPAINGATYVGYSAQAKKRIYFKTMTLTESKDYARSLGLVENIESHGKYWGGYGKKKFEVPFLIVRYWVGISKDCKEIRDELDKQSTSPIPWPHEICEGNVIITTKKEFDFHN